MIKKKSIIFTFYITMVLESQTFFPATIYAFRVAGVIFEICTISQELSEKQRVPQHTGAFMHRHWEGVFLSCELINQKQIEKQI